MNSAQSCAACCTHVNKFVAHVTLMLCVYVSLITNLFKVDGLHFPHKYLSLLYADRCKVKGLHFPHKYLPYYFFSTRTYSYSVGYSLYPSLIIARFLRPSQNDHPLTSAYLFICAKSK
ncbi:Os09g0419100 [Oryza sativa Japonica Group]|uniref:Os09g0419100 protein n=3 Tax=Oryza sativa subsp. japonica TaxID=39947 RepID=Q0J1R3_ORYSJ|nr:Os09g0419100 [Oryza sativa Japonica Group]BAH00432.1 unnamed protein product [Oryza sativa Japonica Group]BAT08109.1 Os09g0419100 [Oryza sativa Japonica Group]|eukprot:NP_001063188.1 Os09g0419100 [Oryza sativa Japonica Group]